MDNPIAFFCRAKPQKADAFETFEKAGRVFIGYPMLRKGARYNPHALRACLVNPACPDEEWAGEITGRSSTRSFNKNRNFIRRVTPGSIVVIPRPEQGAVYVGRITGPFEIVHSPPWADAYLNLREKQGLNRPDDGSRQHVADVAQGWQIDQYRRVDLSRVPGWLRRSMFGRSTYGPFKDHPIDQDVTAYAMFGRILAGKPTVDTSWTLRPDEIKRRLVDTLTANAFEHLIVSLLQLEHPDEIWYQTGGPGDGGIDGLGSDERGEVVGLMQSKLYASSAPGLGELRERGSHLRRYVAVLVLENPEPPTDGTKLLDLEWIADAVRRHWRALPQAHAMRVGQDT